MAVTPVQLPPDALLRLHAANPSRYPVLLQSAAHSEQLGRYDILFACPQAQLALRSDGSLYVESHADSVTVDSPFDLQQLTNNTGFLKALDQWWQAERESSDASLPFSGGWFVFLSYEMASEVEPSLKLPKDLKRDMAVALRIPAAIIVRHDTQQAWLVTEQKFAALQPLIQMDIAALSASNKTNAPSQLLASELIEDQPEIHLNNVRRALEYIAAGDIYQANLSRGWQAMLAADVQPHHVFARLRKSNPAPFAALAVLNDRAIVSSSPERLLGVRDGLASTRPIAGTRPRSMDRNDDVEKKRELHGHPKERAEHVMLIDLERNDLGRVCEAGSVHVSEFMVLESYEHVHHIVSNVEGKLRSDVTPGQALAAVFPGGTITGCPKVRCMEIIGELEACPRGAYTGSLGYLNLDGSMDTNILIRTFDIYDGAIHFRAGGGVVSDSIPEKELEETRAKARGLVRAFDTQG
jgi:anthranilate synthase component I